MSEAIFSERDIDRIINRGLSLETVEKQMEMLTRGPRFVRLDRPCTAGDGIVVVDEDRCLRLQALASESSARGRCMKFVPASGAATRMFKDPLRVLESGEPVTREDLASLAERGDEAAAGVISLMDRIRDAAFYPELKRTMAGKGLHAESLLAAGGFEPVLRHLVGPEGLDYGNLPKGLLIFHRYRDEARTAFEEHLVEAVDYVGDRLKHNRLHFTVSPEHMTRFRELAETASSAYRDRFDASFDIGFSTQSPATDTIAVHMGNRPFRLPDGRLLFRPGGHGSLLENLAALGGDIVYLKNIDNVVPDHLKKDAGRWKRVLGGLLVELQQRVFDCLGKLSGGDQSDQTIAEAERVFTGDLSGSLPDGFTGWPLGRRSSFFMDALNRPMRVCGMVRNQGEPGGGPFWVREKDGRISLQIVESAQVDPGSASQQALLAGATHFNPVDLVCGLRGLNGKPFDLQRFVDPDTALVSTKSLNGTDLKALEHPGLWNGGMAKWLTVFVEVPLSTFNPVKTVNDLLRPSHQPVCMQ